MMGCFCVIIAVSLNHYPVVDHPPVTGEIQVPAAVKQIFVRSCFSCHSSQTELKWYDKLPVVSAIVSRDVTEARKRFNFSAWDSLSAADQKVTLWEIYNMINAGKMPLGLYTAIHPEAKVSASDLSVLRNYLNTLSVTSINDTSKEHEAIVQHSEWQQQQTAVNQVPVSVNGIKHRPEYRNWQVMSTTSRFDNGTMRVMYANPIAARAINDHQINPWPDGSVLTKVVWEKLEDKDGNVRPGKFVNIQYMVRDKEKYRDTEGWGFARFDTPELRPYGKLSSFKKMYSLSSGRKGNRICL